MGTLFLGYSYQGAYVGFSVSLSVDRKQYIYIYIYISNFDRES